MTLVVKTDESWWPEQPYNYPGPELAHPNIHPIYDLWENTEGLIL